MEDRTFFTNNHPTDGISDSFREFIEALVEEVALNGEPFDAKKKWLRKFSEGEGVDYVSLEKNLEDLFQIIEEWRVSQSKSSQIAMKMLAKDCFLSDSMVKKIMEVSVSTTPVSASTPSPRPAPTQSDIEFVDPMLLIHGGSIVEIEKDGHVLVPLWWDYAENFHEGLARVQTDERYGFVDQMGNPVIPCSWKYAEAFSEGLAFTINDNGEGLYIDKTGRIAINSNPEYDYYVFGTGFHDGLAEVKKGNLYGFMDKSGRIAIPCSFKDVCSFEEGLASFEDDQGKFGCIDTRGRVVIPCQHDEHIWFYEGIATVYMEQGEGGSYLIDKTGRKICDLGFECGIVYFKEGLGSIEDYGFIDKNGKLVIEDIWSPEGLGFCEGLAPTYDGFIDHSGQVVIPGDWDDYDEFSDGLARVKTNDKWGYIDHSGHMSIPNIWDYAGNFCDGLAPAELAGRYYFINKQGKVLCNLKRA